jgi:tetratricopeptide (TPR) repeat protein
MGRLVKIFLFLGVLGLGLFSQASTVAAPAAGATSWLQYGHRLYQQKRYGEALAAYQQAALIDPQDAVTQQSLGNALVQLSRYPEAVQAYQRSLQLKPDNAPLTAYLAQLQAHLGAAQPVDLEEPLADARGLLEQQRFGEALKLFQASPAGSERSSPWQQGKAEALYGLGRMEDARATMRLAASLDPANKEAQDQLRVYLHADAASDGGGVHWFAPLWRSALLPGWGQAYNGQRRKAWVLGGLTWGLFAATAATYVAAGTALDDYHALGPGRPASDFDNAFTKADNLAVANEAVGLLFYTAYAYNLFDAAAQARPVLQAEIRGQSPVLAWHQAF